MPYDTIYRPKNYDSKCEETGGPSPGDCPKAWQQITEMICEYRPLIIRIKSCTYVID